MTRSRRACSSKVESSRISALTDMREAVQEAADLLRSIGSEYRLIILHLLAGGTKTVTEIRDAIGERQSLVSQHLSRLRVDGLVQAKRQGNFVFYTLSDTPAKQVVAALHRHFCLGGPTAGKKRPPRPSDVS